MGASHAAVDSEKNFCLTNTPFFTNNTFFNLVSLLLNFFMNTASNVAWVLLNIFNHKYILVYLRVCLGLGLFMSTFA